MMILTDEQLTYFPMSKAIEAVGRFFKAAKAGKTYTPPRHNFASNNGRLVFTIGSDLQNNTLGFRVYDTLPLPTDPTTKDREGAEQIVAVYRADASQLKGLVIGHQLGAIRTAAINGFAMQQWLPVHLDQALIIGAGYHSHYQLTALMTVAKPDLVFIHNRTRANAERLAKWAEQRFNREFKVAEDLETAVRQSQAILCTTSARTPVLQANWLSPGTYVSSMGPKVRDQSELPKDIANCQAVFATDAPEQIHHYGGEFLLPDHCDIQPLEQINKPQASDIRFFFSSGRSGTEVAVADAALRELKGLEL